MKKSKSTTKPRFKTEKQAIDFVAGELAKMMSSFMDKDINDDFSCELVMYLVGQHILAKGDVATFQHIFNQLIENNQLVFAMGDIDPNDDGTFH
jgi:hypothetical protein